MCMEREGFVCCLRVCMAQVWLDLKRWPTKACGALMKQDETTGDRWIKNKNHFQEEPMLLCSNLFINLTVFLFTCYLFTELMSNQPSCKQLTFHPLKVGFFKNVWRFQYPVCRFSVFTQWRPVYEHSYIPLWWLTNPCVIYLCVCTCRCTGCVKDEPQLQAVHLALWLFLFQAFPCVGCVMILVDSNHSFFCCLYQP